MTKSISDSFKDRRTIYALTNESTISDDRLEELLTDVVLHTPSPFNSQTSRLVVLLKDEHQKLWDIAYEVASSTVPPEVFDKVYKLRIAMFRGGYGTVLFYEDPAPIRPLEEKWPMLTDKFPQWSEHANAMHQYAREFKSNKTLSTSLINIAVWTLLEAEGLGCSLQHYNPMFDAHVAEQWKVPADWSLKAQLVFGKPIGGPREKTSEPVNQRLFVHGK
ncbi:Nitroreductase family protein [Aspergillus parasiticus SU-1]|uniref:Nitroreductase family protein n=1 Tax=Aspergillus parasiticus (strain ATCC 56775 / NRRL 5862 / SRRC 143 / SU-1) TaxID=1403190 RepID=A0A0F0IB93_ASPPU|nr:Nitroreductase family protein [Aspergillus parasiticus SU-1]